ncbi:LAFE_0G04346g1_1 [Lachancea fermentati]|uniref:LAFE_0G04346g1_1 n=1 Tax=Lachancea fermentati TaxID=4955 RepID=A0A1G4MH50_LACFM|nr:LAFE_0G04346g1_1 [Lachancea fermentati]
MFDEFPRWVVYSSISSLLCIGGSFCVPLISGFCRSSASVNSKLLNYGLSVSAGSMMTTSLYKMLPHGAEDKKMVFLGFLVGTIVSFILNFVVHAYTSESLIHGNHSDSDDDHHSHPNESALLDHSNISIQAPAPKMKKANSTLKSMPSLIDLLAKNETQAGSCYGSTSCVPMEPTTSAGAPLTTTTCHANQEASAIVCPENGIGYDLENLSVYRNHFLSGKVPSSHAAEEDSSSSHSGIASVDHHHHHVATPFSKLISIGVQTCVVIALHKFPEGLIIFYTNNEDDHNPSSLGFSIFLSLAMHNFIEGFSMTLPLYTAFKTKWHAVLIASLLGGGSQPLGACLGYFLLRGNQSKEIHVNFLLSLTSGFLFVIGLQMFQTAIGFSDSHHHHQNDASPSENHCLATTCLKWCCLGALLIIGSGIFS